MEGVMNAFAQTSASALSGSKLDNRRMLAVLIDLAIVGVGGAVILAAAGDGASVGAPLVAVVVGWALYYWFACESGGGQTVGKKLMRLRVVRVDGGPADMQAIAVRTVLRLVDTALVGLIAMMATGERRARLGDLAAGTMIMSTDGSPSPAPVVTAPAAIEAPETDDEPEPVGDELAEDEDSAPPRAYEPITGVQVVEEAEHTLDIATPSLKELAEDVAAATGGERVADVEPEPQPRPLAEVEIGGPEIDVEEPQVTVRSVETVSAIDLVMGADDPSEDPPAADSSPAGA
jgi:uncharacterized RDD family membrane protein YckC